MSGETAIAPDEPDRNRKQSMTSSAKSLFHDLSALRLNGADATAGAVEVLTHVPVRKPNRHEFFRVYSDDLLDTTVFTDKEERESYLVTPPYASRPRRRGSTGHPRARHHAPEGAVHLAGAAPRRGWPAQCLDGHGPGGDAFGPGALGAAHARHGLGRLPDLSRRGATLRPGLA